MAYPRQPGFGYAGQPAGSPPMHQASGAAPAMPGFGPPSAPGLYTLNPTAPGGPAGAGFMPGPAGYGSHSAPSTGPPPGFGQPSAGGYGMLSSGNTAGQPNMNAGSLAQNFPNATGSGTYPAFPGQAPNSWPRDPGSARPPPGIRTLPDALPSSKSNTGLGLGVVAGGAASNATGSAGYPGVITQGPTSTGANQHSYAPGLGPYPTPPGKSSPGYALGAPASSASYAPAGTGPKPPGGQNVQARRTSSTLSPEDRELLEAIMQFDAALMGPPGGGKK